MSQQPPQVPAAALEQMSRRAQDRYWVIQIVSKQIWSRTEAARAALPPLVAKVPDADALGFAKKAFAQAMAACYPDEKKI
jgi:hypothetical protein